MGKIYILTALSTNANNFYGKNPVNLHKKGNERLVYTGDNKRDKMVAKGGEKMEGKILGIRFGTYEGRKFARMVIGTKIINGIGLTAKEYKIKLELAEKLAKDDANLYKDGNARFDQYGRVDEFEVG